MSSEEGITTKYILECLKKLEEDWEKQYSDTNQQYLEGKNSEDDAQKGIDALHEKILSCEKIQEQVAKMLKTRYVLSKNPQKEEAERQEKEAERQEEERIIKEQKELEAKSKGWKDRFEEDVVKKLNNIYYAKKGKGISYVPSKVKVYCHFHYLFVNYVLHENSSQTHMGEIPPYDNFSEDEQNEFHQKYSNFDYFEKNLIKLKNLEKLKDTEKRKPKNNMCPNLFQRIQGLVTSVYQLPPVGDMTVSGSFIKDFVSLLNKIIVNE